MCQVLKWSYMTLMKLNISITLHERFQWNQYILLEHVDLIESPFSNGNFFWKNKNIVVISYLLVFQLPKCIVCDIRWVFSLTQINKKAARHRDKFLMNCNPLDNWLNPNHMFLVIKTQYLLIIYSIIYREMKWEYLFLKKLSCSN